MLIDAIQTTYDTEVVGFAYFVLLILFCLSINL
jgi:hypothetical protein